MFYKITPRQLAVIAVVIVAIAVWCLITVINLQSDHTTLCANVAQTMGTNLRAWGC